MNLNSLFKLEQNPNQLNTKYAPAGMLKHVFNFDIDFIFINLMFGLCLNAHINKNKPI